MGKKQAKTKGKFDNVEISSPILDAEIIKAIHTPPNQKQKEGGFKALFANSGSQDLLNDIPAVNQHLPSYVGISCAISGYTNYSPYLKSARSGHNSPSNNNTTGTARSATNPSSIASPPSTDTKTSHLNQTLDTHGSKQYNQLHNANDNAPSNQHNTIDWLTPNLRQSPSPSMPRKENDRHHGTCVGARYCLLPAPDKIVNKHIPLLGIDDDKVINDDDELETEANKSVQKRIASLYGDQFAEGWKESNANKARKDIDDSNQLKEKLTKNSQNIIKDLVKLKPTPTIGIKGDTDINYEQVNLPDNTTLSKAPVFAGVEKQFLGQLLSNGVSIKPTSQVPRASNSNTRSESSTQKASQAVDQPTKIETPAEMAIKQLAQRKPKENSPEIVKAVLEDDGNLDFTTQSNDHDGSVPDIIESPKALRHNPDQRGDDLLINEHLPSGIRDEERIHNSESNLPGKTQTDQPEENYGNLIDISGADSEPKEDVNNLYPHEDQSNLIFGLDDIHEKVPSEILIPQQDDLFDTQGKPMIEDEPAHSEELHQEEMSKDLLGRERIMHDKELSNPSNDSLNNEDEHIHSDSNSRDGQYFLEQLKSKSDGINRNVERAEGILNDEVECQSLDEEVLGKIHSAIGKANLLLNKKCKQFKELCADNLASDDNKDNKFATLNGDLEGFWDMIVIQLNECDEAFNQLWVARDNGWKFADDQAQESSSSSSGRSSQHSKTSKPKLNVQKDKERKNRLQEHINQMKQKEAANPQRRNSDELLEDFIEQTQEPRELSVERQD